MPSPKAVLRDIHDFDLDPNVDHRSIKASGRLTKHNVTVDSHVTIAQPIVEIQTPAVVEETIVETTQAPVELEPELNKEVPETKTVEELEKPVRSRSKKQATTA